MSAAGVYGGDEVGAIVLDWGSNTIRAGFAGEDLPKADIPSLVGVCEGEGSEHVSDMSVTGEEGLPEEITRKTRCLINTVNIKPAREGMIMKNCLLDGMIEDWDIYENVIDYIYSHQLHTTQDAHPLLMSEPAWNTRAKREKLTELMFERYNVPAFYLCKNAVLSAFASGRSTGLVLDSGATHTTAVPVYDGYVIQSGVVRTPLGGDSIVDECRKTFESLGIDVVPQYQVASKEPVLEGEAARWCRRKLPEGLTQSYAEFCERELIQDFIASVVKVSDEDYDKELEAIEATPSSSYEMPNGFHRKFGVERFKIGESLFNSSFRSVLATAQNVDQVVTSSIGQCDIDIRPSLVNSVIVVGGNTLLRGFCDRLTNDLTSKLPPSMKLKLITSSTSATERRFSSWIGGSILASLGSFQQLWFTKLEYEEYGRTCIERKCP